MSRCDRCGRFIGEDCMEGVDWSKGIQHDGDVAWTGRFYCAYGVGCNSDESDESGDSVLFGLELTHSRPTWEGDRD